MSDALALAGLLLSLAASVVELVLWGWLLVCLWRGKHDCATLIAVLLILAQIGRIREHMLAQP